MASFQKTREGTWRAFVCTLGVRDTATRDTKAEVVAWATARETEIRAGKRGQIIPRTVRQALERYAAEVSPTMKGARWERVRLAKLGQQLPFAGRLLADVTAADIAGWRDDALTGKLAPRTITRKDGTTVVRAARPLSSASVRREMGLLRGVFERARREWGWLRDNPMTEVAVPPPGAARDRRIAEAEIAALCGALGWDGVTGARTVSQRVAAAFLLAIETGMRAGELVGLTWGAVSKAGRYVSLPRTKNGDARQVPLSRAALAILELLPEAKPGDAVLGISSDSLDAMFRKARDRLGIVDLHFHDTRHEATTRLARKLDVLDLARVLGHRDLKSLRVYYNATATEIAARLD